MMRSAHSQVRRAHARRAQAAACSSGGFIAPTLGQTINSLQPLNISWDTSCLTNVQSIDIVLSAPGANNPLLQGWKNVPFSSGSRVVELFPRLWNDSASQVLQLNLYKSGTPSFMSPLPAGPVITATYSAPSGSVPAAADMSLNNASSSSSASQSSSHGKTAAAVLFPLLLVIGAILDLDQGQATSRQRKTEALVRDAGAQAAIRHSMAVSTRNSAFSFGAIRPPSMVADPTSPPPDMAQIRRPGTGLRNAALAEAIASGERVSRVSFADTATRVSRVSFATDPRPSTDSRRTAGTSRASRAFHSAYAPPVPSLPAVYSPKEKVKQNPDEVDVNLSPRQTAGPLTLSPEDIRVRIQSGKDDDDVLPALAMMRTGSRASTNNPFSPVYQPSSVAQIDEEQADDYLLSPGPITMPEPTHYSPADVSSLVPSFPVPMIPAQIEVPPPSAAPVSPTNLLTPLHPSSTTSSVPVMTPDDMIRVYAERQAATPTPTLSRSNTASPFNAASATASSGSYNPDDLLRAYAERRTSAGLKRSSSLFTATPSTDGINPDDMLRAYAERRSSTQATSASLFTSAPSNDGTTPDDMLRAYAVRRAAARTSGSGSGPTPTTPKLEKRPSFSGNAFVGGFAMALAGKKGKKSRESRQVTPPSAYVAPTATPHLRSASSSSSLTGSTGTGVGNVGVVPASACGG
ncbi:hypothetical protein F5887DRAFT_1075262 [Amanita rubescens]|nr:hypothetical protein F5887DRAFT_1075262 [Amanita rubescens]